MISFFALRKQLALKLMLVGTAVFLLQSCRSLADVPTFSSNNAVHVAIEIPAGTNAKIEYNKKLNKLKVDQQNGKDRLIEYLPYPGNYGFIPSTYSDPEKGGDGDPLDALVISSSLLSGSVVETIPIGMLKLMDNGEQDYKVICIPSEKRLQTVSATSLTEFSEKYPDALKIIELWFSNYDPADTIVIEGWGDEKEALAEINKVLKK
ncbi:inorganic diphosphatase [Marixanthomonas spongiae]|uniref:inorganic diphosphatase n=1 Tax=Marixanthomonas spongiae TaxID=2174845 RepID=A0A2U0I7Y1_9FLAO|nr:inorganic diphosphatase [Marixanthomonas spongiae]PVW17196.1 inorganic pyrophosphatase [Marixanthomonas spongiae]